MIAARGNAMETSRARAVRAEHGARFPLAPERIFADTSAERHRCERFVNCSKLRRDSEAAPAFPRR